MTGQSETERLERKIDGVRNDLGNKLDGVQNEVKELTKALRDLIRLDSELKADRERVMRIGKQVDDHEVRLRSTEQHLAHINDHEPRLRKVEGAITVNNTKIGAAETRRALLYSTVAALVVAGVTTLIKAWGA